MFADVVHSLDIAATLDVERLREIMTELLERSAVVAQRYGGTVEFTGDGVMVLFGAPVALEDHAFRSCLAALAIQDEASRLVGEVQRRDGVVLRLRTLLARACGDHDSYRDLVSRYHAMAQSLGFEGHTAWAETMIAGRE